MSCVAHNSKYYPEKKTFSELAKKIGLREERKEEEKIC